jgi:NADP-dependent 3-hydroxy acid dehydrogenase YdfG
MSVTDRTIVLAGATSLSGTALAHALVDAGARVIATGRSAERLEELSAVGARVEVADATSLDAESLIPRVLALWDGEAAELNDQVITLD